MRRALVLSDESARHPFRASLPPHVRMPERAVSARPTWHIGIEDMRAFVGSYFAGLVAVAIFII